MAQQLTTKRVYAPLKARKTDEFRDIPIPRYLAAKVAGHVPQPDGYPFAAVDRRQYNRWFNDARDRAGIPDRFTPHSLRHVFASVALSHGVSISDIGAWLGHRSIQLTFGTYGHLAPSAWDKTRNALDEEYESRVDES